MLVGVVLLPFTPKAMILLLALVIAVSLLSFLHPVPAIRRFTSDRSKRAMAAQGSWEMALHLSPVLLLTAIFPIATLRIDHTRLAGTPLTSLLLASSLTIPWLSQAVCLPLYRAVGPMIAESPTSAIRSRLCEVWLSVYVQSLPSIILFAVPVEIFMHLSVAAMSIYLAMCVLNLAFVQSLVLGIIARQRKTWAIAWAGYAFALLVIPVAWFLPPLVGLATQVWPMRREIAKLRRPVWLDHREVAVDVIRGVLLGSVMWADKFFYYLQTKDHFAVDLVFLALLPAILAYNYYFVRLAPVFDDAVSSMRIAMEREPYSTLAARSSALSAIVETSLARAALAGATLAFVVTAAVAEWLPGSVDLVAAVSLASWLFMMITISCYKLDYVGQKRQAQAFSAVHLAGCAVLFGLLPAGAELYTWLVVFESVVLAGSVAACLAQWRSSEYALFWRHATAW